ncbi:hypothetical protein [Paludisphaera sp.]|uniref:hypothetical protein n=1 Tax=Paludisphaera sp. TaxID=2017432 RepID=UPI00301C1F08
MVDGDQPPIADGLPHALKALATRLVDLAARDDGLRDDLRALAIAVLTATERPEAVAAPAAEEAAADDREPEPAPPPSPRPPLPELTLGRAPAPAPPPPPAEIRAERETADDDLPGIEARCRLKAEGLRWAARRRGMGDEGADYAFEIAPRDRDILDRARAANCYLWMNTPDFAVPSDPSPLEDAAGCFEAVADAVGLVRGLLPDIERDRRFFEPALDLLAEAQSALRVAVERLGVAKDREQYAAYDWLRGIAAREQIYIRRYMRIDDPAPPSGHPGIQARIERLDAGFQETLRQGKARKSLLSKARYHARRVAGDAGDAHDWAKIAESVDALIAGGEPPSSVEIREILLPILERMPDLGEPPRNLRLVLREIDRYLAARRPAAEAAPAPEPPTPEVVEAARLLRGKSVVLIGGARRPESHEAIARAFDLKELNWIETREHESIAHFEHSVARPDVALVILAIRWSSHSFGDVKEFCDRHGKPLLRLPRGYSPNQVAHEVLGQCSERLAPSSG